MLEGVELVNPHGTDVQPSDKSKRFTVQPHRGSISGLPAVPLPMTLPP